MANTDEAIKAIDNIATRAYKDGDWELVGAALEAAAVLKLLETFSSAKQIKLKPPEKHFRIHAATTPVEEPQ